MEPNQIARMIEWLDEERRRDKARIAKMEERLLQQQEVVDTLTRRVTAYEGETTTLRGLINPTPTDAELMDHVRAEISQSLAEIEARRVTAEREAERRADVSRENMMRPMREVGERVDKIERSIDEIRNLSANQETFAQVIQNLQTRVEEAHRRIEEPDRRLTYLEEQRRQDVRRISEAQTELPEIRKLIEGIRAKADALETVTRRNERTVLEVQATETERRANMQQFVDQQNLLLHQRDQRIEEITRTFGQYDEAMRRNMERFETWSEVHRQMKKIVEDFDRMVERLERKINEVGEIQRLSEGRFRTEWDDWKREDGARWNQFTGTNDEMWNLNKRDTETVRGKIGDVAQQLNLMFDSIDRLWKLQRAQVDMFRDNMSTLLNEHDQPIERPSIRTTGTYTAITNANTSGNGRS